MARQCIIKGRTWLYKWLPVFFGCHCRPERSFHYKGVQFPICARCTGELAGILIALLTHAAGHPGAVWSAVLLLPLVIDGVIQLCTPYESRNLRRLWTGVLFGYGLTNLLLLSSAGVFRRGYAFGLELKDAL